MVNKMNNFKQNILKTVFVSNNVRSFGFLMWKNILQFININIFFLN